MLQNGGTLDGARLLSRKSVECMTSNQLPASIGYGPTPGTSASPRRCRSSARATAWGWGCGLRRACRPFPARSATITGGATGPYFGSDGREGLSVVMMLQELNALRRTRYRALLRNLVYQALD